MIYMVYSNKYSIYYTYRVNGRICECPHLLPFFWLVEQVHALHPRSSVLRINRLQMSTPLTMLFCQSNRCVHSHLHSSALKTNGNPSIASSTHCMDNHIYSVPNHTVLHNTDINWTNPSHNYHITEPLHHMPI